MKIKTSKKTMPFFDLNPGDVFRTANGLVGMKVEDATVDGITLNAVILSTNRMAEVVDDGEVELLEDATLILQEV